MEAILITGASCRVGAEIAKELAQKGYFIWIHCHQHRRDAEALCEQIHVTGGSAAVVQADLCSATEMDRMLEEISADERSALTTLINNAAVMLPGTISETDEDDWNLLMNTNLKAVWYLSKQFTEIFPCAARIINIGDANVSRGYFHHAIYGLSKSALKYLTEQLAEAFAPRVHVNLISPALLMKSENESEFFWQSQCEKRLINRSDAPDGLLQSILFLLSDPGMTGSELFIDNGLHLNRTFKNKLQ